LSLITINAVKRFNDVHAQIALEQAEE